MDYPALIAFFDEYNAHFRDFLKFEYAKIDMLHKGEIEKLANSLSTEQAFIMKSGSLEKRRIKITGDNVTFAQIVENAPPEFKSALDERYRSLSQMVLKIKEINDNANAIVTERLKKIRTRSGGLDTYNGHGDVKKENAVNSTMSTNA